MINHERRTQNEITRSEAFTRSVLDAVGANIAVLDSDGSITAVNKAWQRFARDNGDVSEGSATGVGVNYLDVVHHARGESTEGAREALDGIQDVLSGRTNEFTIEYPCHSPTTKRWFMLRATSLPGDAGGAVLAHINITDKKIHELQNEMALQVLKMLNSGDELHQLADDLLDRIQRYAEVDAIGIRLRQGEDFPYFLTKGFSSRFIAEERSILTCEEGTPARDQNGEPVFECMCGKVIQGRFDPSMQYFTPYGSFWVNSTSELISSNSADKPLAGTRERCNKEGYESVVLIPLRSGKEVIGLLQLNDRRKGVFSLEQVQFLEGIGSSIGIAVARRQSREALQESEDLFRKLFHNHSAVKLNIDANTGEILDANEAAVQFYGWPLKQLKTMKIQDINTLDGKEIKEMIDEVRRRQRTQFEFRHRLADGSTRDVEVFSTCITNNEREIIHSIIHDITNRKRAESALRESERKYRAVIENASDVIFTTDLFGNYDFTNMASTKISGYSHDELRRMNFADLIDPRYKRKVQAHYMRQYRLKEQSTFLEYPFIARNGESIWLAQNTSLIYEGGEITGYHNIARNINDRKRIEKALEDERILLKTIIDNMPAAIYAKDIELRKVLLNSADMQNINCPENEVLGHTDMDYLPQEVAEKTMADDLSVIETGEPITGREELIANFKGEQRWLLTSKIPWKDNRGSIIGLVGVGVDITERKKAQEIQKNMERRQFQSQKLEAIGTLAGGIAHDFNNILTSVLGFSELLLDRFPEETEEHRDLSRILNSCNRATELVNEILEFSRQQEGEDRPMLVAPIIKESLKLLRASLPSTIEIRQDIRSQTATVMADPAQIHQVIMNLCTNAADAMSAEGGVLEISLSARELDDEFLAAHPELLPGTYLDLMVRDTGDGIEPDILPKIFEPYFTTKDKSGGSGLGLSIVHGIITRCNGTVTVESEAGGGSTFHIYLPILSQSPDFEKRNRNEIERGHERILLVDDEFDVLEVGKRMLKSLGYRVTATNGSPEALDLFQSDPGRFDLVISDITMPFMTGDELSREILRSRTDIPVILISGFSDRITNEAFQDIRICAHLKKPFSKSELAVTVRNVLDKTCED